MPPAHAERTSRIERARKLVWHIWEPLSSGTDGAWQAVPLDRFADDLIFHGPAPVGRLSGRAAYEDAWVARLARSFPNARREPYLFLAGEYEGSTWVATTGNLVGALDHDFLGVPAQTEQAWLRFGEFYLVIDGRVVEVRCLIDLLGLAARFGFELLPPFPASAELAPPPALGNGLVFGPQDPTTTAETLQLVEDMLGGCNRLVDGELRSMGMDAYWHEDMCWYGPWGVGGTHGFDEFQRWAQGPSVASFPNRRGGFHQARFADGLTAAFTGWPSLQGTFDGVAFRGIEPTGGPIGQNIMDFYVRRGPLLHENWVLIDLVDFALQCGVDLLAALPGER